MKKTIQFLVCIAVFTQCKDQDLATIDTSQLVVEKIMASNCQSCHGSTNTSTFREHNLVLSTTEDLLKMVGASPKNITAKEANLKLIDPFNAENSLLYQKLLFETSHSTGLNFGNTMPLGGDLLKKGEVEFIKRWIDAGAPSKGQVADVSLLSDPTPSLAKLEPLAAPKASEGYQMKLDPFEIYGNFEREVFMNKPLGNSETILVNKFQLRMHPGSHHFILYGFRDSKNLPQQNILRDLRYQNGSYDIGVFSQMSNHIYYFGGSENNFTFNFPEGTAVELPANMKFDMNSHYFNKGTKSYNGEVYINLYKADPNKVTKKLKVLDLGNTNLNIPANTRVIHTKSFNFAQDAKIVTLFSHTHKMGEKFEILIKGGSRDGELIYTSTNWEHPRKIDFANPISLKAGQGLTSRITYNNDTDQNVSFGLTSKDEMGIIFGYYYLD